MGQVQSLFPLRDSRAKRVHQRLQKQPASRESPTAWKPNEPLVQRAGTTLATHHAQVTCSRGKLFSCSLVTIRFLFCLIIPERKERIQIIIPVCLLLQKPEINAGRMNRKILVCVLYLIFIQPKAFRFFTLELVIRQGLGKHIQAKYFGLTSLTYSSST